MRVSLSVVLLLMMSVPILAEQQATIQFHIDSIDGQTIPCRIHLANSQGEPQKAAGEPFWKDHFVCSGRVTVSVEPGTYHYAIERGPEYEQLTGVAKVEHEQALKVALTLERIATLREEGWYSGDLHVHRPVNEIEQLMKAEDLDFAPVITWWNAPRRNATETLDTVFRFDGNRIYETLAGEDEREGGALLYFGLRSPLDLTVESREFPSPMRFVQQARDKNPNVWIDIEKPFWWDVPTWLASGKMNSIGIANNHMCRSQMYEDEAWGRPRDAKRLPPPRGNGYWTQEIYYHALNAGIRLPPSAGSASGVLPNPVGYNRVYVHLDEPFTRDAWFRGLARGDCFVTNGPLLRVTADKQRSGSDFEISGNDTKSISLDINLASRDPIKQLEFIYNGRVAKIVPCEASVSQAKTVELAVSEPGWFLVRAISDIDGTFRFASTAPWYVNSNAKGPRISKRSSQFFLNWIDERIARIRANVTDDTQLQAVIKPHRDARQFWADRVDAANADLESYTIVPNLPFSKNDPTLTLDLYLPTGQTHLVPCVMAIQGGGFYPQNGQRYKPFAEHLASSGFAAALISYRGQPKHQYRETIADVKAAVRHIRRIGKQHQIDTTRIGAMGSSAGGTLAALLAVRNDDDDPDGRVEAAVCFAGVFDFVGRFTDAEQIALQPNLESKQSSNGKWIGAPFSPNDANWRDASAMTHVDRTDSPILFLHSKDDSVVPWIQSRDMHGAMRDVGIKSEIHTFDTGGHGVRPVDEDPMEIMTSFFRKHL